MSCKVAGCRFSQFHVTSYHMCGTCREQGHGQMECGDKIKKEQLKQYFGDNIHYHMKCTIIGCPNPLTHTSCGHVCNYCYKMHNQPHLKNCPHNPKFNGELLTPIGSIGMPDQNPVTEFVGKLMPGYYSYTYGGMGCTWFVRNNHGVFETLFMHSDAWGQYGDDASDIPIFNAFKDGYTEIKNDVPSNYI